MLQKRMNATTQLNVNMRMWNNAMKLTQNNPFYAELIKNKSFTINVSTL